MDETLRGRTVQLISMDDPQAPEPGTKGIIMGVDDIGQIHVRWSDNSTLALIPGLDEYTILTDGKKKK